MIHILGKTNSLFNQFISELRDENIQKDQLRFRRNLERIGEVFAYEISKYLDYETRTVTTPLGEAEVPVLKEFPILATILRAGLPLHQGMLNYFDQSPNAFVSAYRMKKKGEDTSEIRVEYSSSPDLEKKVLILCDPMLATGDSMLATYKELLTNGTPRKIHIVSVLASTEGINTLKRMLPTRNITYWLGAVDDELTASAYIVPGLGDAGDLAFGTKS